MAEYVANAVQTVAVGQNVLFTDDIDACRRGYIWHRAGSGLFTLRGIVNNPSACSAKYKVSFGANIAIAAGGTAGPISLALAIDGEPIPTSQAIVTPAAVGDYWNIYESIYITIPRGCCYTIAVQNTGTQAVDVINANIIVERTA